MSHSKSDKSVTGARHFFKFQNGVILTSDVMLTKNGQFQLVLVKHYTFIPVDIIFEILSCLFIFIDWFPVPFRCIVSSYFLFPFYFADGYHSTSHQTKLKWKLHIPEFRLYIMAGSEDKIIYRSIIIDIERAI